ncbi:hypothetical protein AC578_3640 [Pseudocercospora eumusae]|uniref:Enoyl-CoA hydratase n=1 Tax=Pseudocercospora eumusae TaxID=321146 RepID=A0A139HPK5_9PEZI|nr:hypothetical protein AC578_3640 [Pseudocercospora eumusae]
MWRRSIGAHSNLPATRFMRVCLKDCNRGSESRGALSQPLCRSSVIRTTRPAFGISPSRPYSSNHEATAGYPGVSHLIEAHTPNSQIATVQISNPAKMNIVNTAILDQLIQTCKTLSANPDIRAVILTGSPTSPGKSPSFIGGADIKQMASLTSPSEARCFILKIHESCSALRNIPVPVIAKVNGWCLGAGLEMLASCDLKVATRNSVFAMPEVAVGIPSVVEAALLPLQIGMGRARRLLYLGEHVSAQEAERWGLIEEVVEGEEELEKVVGKWTDKICGMGPKAMRSQKALMRAWEGNMGVEEGIVAGVEAFAEAFEDGMKEPKEYMGKFLVRRRRR